jgi:hypothetical protein
VRADDVRPTSAYPALVRRIGVLIGGGENDPGHKRRLSAFTQALAGFGWTDGRNVRIYVRRYGDDTDRIRALAQELIGLQPDIILTVGTPATIALQRETRTIPIVFTAGGDPVVSGIVARLDRPGGNVTGFGAPVTARTRAAAKTTAAGAGASRYEDRPSRTPGVALPPAMRMVAAVRSATVNASMPANSRQSWRDMGFPDRNYVHDSGRMGNLLCLG